jgi:hypothetical protein
LSIGAQLLLQKVWHACCFAEIQEDTVQYEIPRSIKDEHKALHAELVEATHAGGKTAVAAKRVAALMHPHFLKEEEMALPPLGLLNALAAGRVDPEMREVLALTNRLEAELPAMLEEHRVIVEALRELITVATAEDQPRFVRFAHDLIHHATVEEQVMYPAALLVGAHLRAKLAGAAGSGASTARKAG